MIGAAEFSAYSKAIDSIADRSRSTVETQILAWIKANPTATVAEEREAAKEIMAGVAQVYDEAAASLAAQWYDSRMQADGASVPAALTSVAYKSEEADAVARLHAEKLTKGDVRGFAKGCAAYAANDARHSVSDTMLGGASRNWTAGVRYARIVADGEACTFCMMLASRGAVYATRGSAGEEWAANHRGCRCKIVAGVDRSAQGRAIWTSDATKRERLRAESALTREVADVTLVEGRSPKTARQLWDEFKGIDADPDMTPKAKAEAKHAALRREGWES